MLITILKDMMNKYQEDFYFLGRIFAVFIFGPILLYKGRKFKDKFLILLGILLMVWDGIKLFFQLDVVLKEAVLKDDV